MSENLILTIVSASLGVIVLLLLIGVCWPLRRLWKAMKPIDFQGNSVDLTHLDELNVHGIGTIRRITQRFKEFVDAVCDRVETVNDIKDLSEKDTLTGCFNKQKLSNMQGIYENLPMYVVIFFDVNNLKKMNDTFGHEAGDVLLKTAAKHLHFWDRFGDVYRMGGDEFMVVLSNVNRQYVNDILNDWYPKVGNLNRESDGFHCVLSYGIAEGHRGVAFDKVEKLADDRMYKMKVALKEHFGEEMR